VRTVYFVAVGNVDSRVWPPVETAVAEWLPFPIARLAPLVIPENAYQPSRGQFQSVELLKALAQAAPVDTARLLGVTEVDLAIPVLSFLFGQAQLDGAIALMSLCRLRQEFYGLPPDEELLRTRAVKEALHELGHTFGLTHCEQAECVMSLATHIGLVDRKSDRYCARCGAHLARRLAVRSGEVI
jgi:archaemetzincin